ncbi:MAG: pyridoxal-phosphate-dependent aminotransferase family protein [Desulfovermiculus sp.]
MLNKQRLLTPGPTSLPEDVRLALARDMIHHRKQDFVRLMQRVQTQLQTLFVTKQPVLPLSCSGTGAMQAAVDNLFSVQDKVLVVDGGKFGERWAHIAEKNKLQIKRLKVQRGQAVSPDEIQTALNQDPDLRGVLVQYSETSTGVLHPLEKLGRITRDSQALLVVDGISGVGISPCPMDDWHIDCLLTGSQKGLMLPPGLALISLSNKAWERVDSLSGTSFYFDLAKEKTKWEQGQTAYTSPINLIMGLKASLNHLLNPDLESIFHKQWALTQMARSGIQAMGLSLLAPTHYTWGLTSFWVPEKSDAQAVLQNMAADFNIILAGGQDELKDRIIRLGHMGYVDWGDILAGLAALGHCLGQNLPGSGRKEALGQAMDAYTRALADTRSAVDKLLSAM